MSLDGKIEQSAAETQAMIKFSHKELDRRVTSLEEGERALEETIMGLLRDWIRVGMLDEEVERWRSL